MEPTLNDMDDYNKPLSHKKLFTIVAILTLLSLGYMTLWGILNS